MPINTMEPFWGKQGWSPGGAYKAPTDYTSELFGDTFSGYDYSSPFYTGGYEPGSGISTYAPSGGGGEATGLAGMTSLNPYVLPHIQGVGAGTLGMEMGNLPANMVPQSSQALINLMAPLFQVEDYSPTPTNVFESNALTAADWANIQQTPHEQYQFLKQQLGGSSQYGQGLQSTRPEADLDADLLKRFTESSWTGEGDELGSLGDIYGIYNPLEYFTRRGTGATGPTSYWEESGSPHYFNVKSSMGDIETLLFEEVQAGNINENSSREDIQNILSDKLIEQSNVPLDLFALDKATPSFDYSTQEMTSGTPESGERGFQRALGEERVGLEFSGQARDYFDHLLRGWKTLSTSTQAQPDALQRSLDMLLSDISGRELGGGSEGVEGLLGALAGYGSDILGRRGNIADAFTDIGSIASEVGKYIPGGEKYEEKEAEKDPIESDIQKKKLERSGLSRSLRKNLRDLLKGFGKGEKKSRYGKLTGTGDAGDETKSYRESVEGERETYKRGMRNIADVLGIPGASGGLYGQIEGIDEELERFATGQVEPKERNILGLERGIKNLAEEIGAPGEGVGIYGDIGRTQSDIISTLQDVFNALRGGEDRSIAGVLEGYAGDIDQALGSWFADLKP